METVQYQKFKKTKKGNRKMINKDERLFNNVFFTKEEYQSFISNVILNAKEEDFPIVVQNKYPGIMDVHDCWGFEEMLKRDTGLHVSLQCPTCNCCGMISTMCIIYP